MRIILFAFLLSVTSGIISCNDSDVKNSKVSVTSTSPSQLPSSNISDSIVKANEASKYHSDSIQNSTSQGTGLTSLDLLLQKNDIEERLKITEEKYIYSKSFTPTISFTAINNSDRVVDVICLSVDLIDGSRTIEQTINKTINS